MTAPGLIDEGDAVALGHGHVAVTPGGIHRQEDRRHQILRHAERQQHGRRGDVEALRLLAGRAADQLFGRVAAQGRLIAQDRPQITGTVEIDGSDNRQRVGAAQFGAGRDPGAGRHPQGGVTAGGMAHDEHASEIEIVGLGQDADVVGGRAPVLQGAGPAAARAPYQPVVDVPRGNTAAGQAGRQGGGMLARGDAISPAAAVDDDGDRVRPLAEFRGIGQAQVAGLHGIGAIGLGRGRRGRRQVIGHIVADGLAASRHRQTQD